MKEENRRILMISDGDMIRAKNKKTYKVDGEFKKATIVANSQAVYLSVNDDKLCVGSKDSISCYGTISVSNLDAGYLMQNASHLLSAFIINDIEVENIIFVLDSKIFKFYETIIFSFVFAVKKYSKQYGTKVFIKKDSSNMDSLANTILEKYNAYAKKYLDLSVYDKSISRFYMISATDYLNNKEEQDKILGSLKVLLARDIRSQDVIKTVEINIVASGAPRTKENKKKIKEISEMLYIQEHIYRAYRLSVFLDSEIFNYNNDNKICMEKNVNETIAVRDYKTKIRMLNIVGAIGLSEKGFNQWVK